MKNIIQLVVISLIALLFSANIYAQNIDFKAANFKNDKEGLKVAVDAIKTGDNFLEEARKLDETNSPARIKYLNALEQYTVANDFNASNDELNYKMGLVNYKLNNKVIASTFFNKAYKLNADFSADMYYYLSLCSLNSYKFDDADKYYNKYKSMLKSSDLEARKRIIREEEAVFKNAKQFYDNPERVWITNIETVNTEYPEYCPAIIADESVLYFNSKRPTNTGGQVDEEGYYFSDPYYCNYAYAKWDAPQKLGSGISTEKSEEVFAIAPDGQQIYIGKIDGLKADVYRYELNGLDWVNEMKFADNKINTADNQSAASFSYDDIKMYYVTDEQSGTKGGSDIFFSGILNERTGEWGSGQTISPVINTKKNEASIFVHPDGKSVYFSSNGHNSMGGYDIFVCYYNHGNWSPPQNLGYPINTPYDEVGFVLSASGKHAYIASNREGQNGSKGDFDIYRVTFLGPEKPTIYDNEDHLLADFINPIQDLTIAGEVKVESKNLTVLKGRIIDDFTKKPVEAEIEIVDNTKNTVVKSIKSNSASGKYLVTLPSGINYGIAVKAEGYLFHSENYDLPITADYQMVEKDIMLKNVAIGNKIVLNNIFFETGKFNIKSESTNELERLVKLMKDIPSLKIEISGHTDNVGQASFNKTLSENRAKAVVNYLVSKGISSSRLVYKGYGSTDPVADNATSKGRQLNRRTEFKVLEN